MKHTLLIATLLCFSTQMALAGELKFIEVTTQAEWKDALKKARTKKQLLFVDVYTDWCGWCKKLDQDVYADDTFAKHYEASFINVKINAEKGYGVEFARDHKVDGFPTLLFMTAEGAIVKTVSGYAPAERLKSIGDAAMSIDKNAASWGEAFQKGTLSPEQMPLYAGLLSEQGDEEKARQVTEAYFSNLPATTPISADAMELASEFGSDMNSAIFRRIIERKDQIAEEELKGFLAQVYNQNLAAAIEAEDQQILARLNQLVIPAFLGNENHPDLPELRTMTYAYYHAGLGRWGQYISTIEQFYEAERKGNTDFLFNMAVNIVQNYQERQVVEAAIRWMDEASKHEGESFRIALARAYLFATAEDNATALGHAKKALSLAQNEEEEDNARQLIGYLE